MISDEAMTVHMRTYEVYTVGNVDIQHVLRTYAVPGGRRGCSYVIS
jgi:hypothetical protein